jgi:hypothetical protein
MGAAIGNFRSAQQSLAKKTGIVRRMCRNVVSSDLQTKIEAYLTQEIKMLEEH